MMRDKWTTRTEGGRTIIEVEMRTKTGIRKLASSCGGTVEELKQIKKALAERVGQIRAEGA
jgi:hypothetical protein